MIILTFSIDFKLISFFHNEIMIIRLKFWMMLNFCKVEYIEYFYTSSKRSKKYFFESLFKNFIIFHKALYFLSTLFVMKINETLRLSVDYRKCNVMIKRSRYVLFLIREIIKKIIECKYFIKLNIIAIFNKFWMYFNNKNYTTFITVWKVYKYCVLLFDLINNLSSFQQYIKDIL